MPSNYKRKTTQQNWDADAMKKAIEAVQSGEMNFSKAATVYNIPRSTLKRRVKNKNVKATDNKKLLGCCAVFTEEQEMELVNVIFHMEEKFGNRLSFLDVRSLAYQLAEKKNLRHTFSRTKQIAGKDWLRGFRKRHPEVVLRNPEIPWLEKGRAMKAAKRAMMAAMNPISSPPHTDDDAEKKKPKKKKISRKRFPVKNKATLIMDAIAVNHEAYDIRRDDSDTEHVIRREEAQVFSDSEVPGGSGQSQDGDETSDAVVNNRAQGRRSRVRKCGDGNEFEINVSIQSPTSFSTLPVNDALMNTVLQRTTIVQTYNANRSNSIILDILNAPSLEPTSDMDLDIISPQSPSEMTIEQKPMYGIRGGIMNKKLL